MLSQSIIRLIWCVDLDGWTLALFITWPPGGVQSIAIFVSVCLSMCLSVSPLTCLKNHVFRLHENFLYVLTVPVACIMWHTSSFEDICTYWTDNLSPFTMANALVHHVRCGGITSAVPNCVVYCIALCRVTHSVLVLASESWFEGSDAPSLRNVMVCVERMRPVVGESPLQQSVLCDFFSALTLVVGWHEVDWLIE